MYLDPAGKPIDELSRSGYRAAGVPGTVMGLDLAATEYGRLARRSLLAPAIALARDLDLPLVRRVQPGHQVQQRGLAAARRAHQGGEVACLDGQVHPPQRPDRRILGLEGLAHPAHDQRGTALAHHSPTLLIL